MKTTADEKQKLIANDLFIQNQHRLTYIADCLYLRGNSAYDEIINILTGLLSISMGNNLFVAMNDTLAYPSTTFITESSSASAQKAIVAKVKTLPTQLWKYEETIKELFAKIEENKSTLLRPFINTDVNNEPIKNMYSADFKKNSHSSHSGKNFLDRTMEIWREDYYGIQDANNFPCFKNFYTIYTSNKGTFSKMGTAISQMTHTLMGNSNKNRLEMHQLLASRKISSFLEVILYAMKNPQSDSAEILKKHFAIDLSTLQQKKLEINLILEQWFPGVLKDIVTDYFGDDLDIPELKSISNTFIR